MLMKGFSEQNAQLYHYGNGNRQSLNVDNISSGRRPSFIQENNIESEEADLSKMVESEMNSDGENIDGQAYDNNADFM